MTNQNTWWDGDDDDAQPDEPTPDYSTPPPGSAREPQGFEAAWGDEDDVDVDVEDEDDRDDPAGSFADRIPGGVVGSALLLVLALGIGFFVLRGGEEPVDGSPAEPVPEQSAPIEEPDEPVEQPDGETPVAASVADNSDSIEMFTSPQQVFDTRRDEIIAGPNSPAVFTVGNPDLAALLVTIVVNSPDQPITVSHLGLPDSPVGVAWLPRSDGFVSTQVWIPVVDGQVVLQPSSEVTMILDVWGAARADLTDSMTADLTVVEPTAPTSVATEEG